jgi:hypothetical protein
MSRGQLAIEFAHKVSSAKAPTSTGHQNGLRPAFHKIQGFDPTPIKKASVVDLRHQAEQRIETAYLFGTFRRLLPAQCGKAELDHVRKAIRCFPARAGNSVTVSDQVTVCDELRLRSIRESRNGARYNCDFSCILTHPASSCSDQKPESPDGPLVGVGSVGSLEHRTFRSTSNSGKLLS